MLDDFLLEAQMFHGCQFEVQIRLVVRNIYRQNKRPFQPSFFNSFLKDVVLFSLKSEFLQQAPLRILSKSHIQFNLFIYTNADNKTV